MLSRIWTSTGRKLISGIGKAVFQPKTVRLSIAQVENLPFQKAKIGPLSCQEWNTHLVEYFNTFRREQSEFRSYFETIIDFLSFEIKGVLGISTSVETEARVSLNLQFTYRFADHVAAEKRMRPKIKKRMIAWTAIFFQLKALSFDIQKYQRGNLPSETLIQKIEKANAGLKEVCEGYKLPINILVDPTPIPPPA